MPLPKPGFYKSLLPDDKTLYDAAEDFVEGLVSLKWVATINEFTDSLGVDGDLWDGNLNALPTPEEVVEYLDDRIEYLEQLAAAEQLADCCDWLATGPFGAFCTANSLVSQLMEHCRPTKLTPQEQALKDLEALKTFLGEDDVVTLEAVLSNIEKALKGIPEVI